MTPTTIGSRRCCPDAVLSIFDRQVVAEALQNRMPLLTRDSAIQAAQVVETIWD